VDVGACVVRFEVSSTTSFAAKCSQRLEALVKGRRFASAHLGGESSSLVLPAEVRSIHRVEVAARAARVECRSTGSIKVETGGRESNYDWDEGKLLPKNKRARLAGTCESGVPALKELNWQGVCVHLSRFEDRRPDCETAGRDRVGRKKSKEGHHGTRLLSTQPKRQEKHEYELS